MRIILCVLALNSVAAVARIPGPFIAHQRDDDIQGGNEEDWRRNAATNYGCDGFGNSFLTRRLSPNTSGSETGMGLEARTL